jgi:hypothetical protein
VRAFAPNVTGDEFAVAVAPPGLAMAVYEVGMPPLVDGVKAIEISFPLSDGAPMVGVSATSTIFVVPAEASLNFDPANPDAFAFVIAILIHLS